MLRQLVIRDVVLIDRLTLDFGPGLGVLTGETGAGKTMVVTGLHLLSGGRADSSRVRRGASRAVIEFLVSTSRTRRSKSVRCSTRVASTL